MRYESTVAGVDAIVLRPGEVIGETHHGTRRGVKVTATVHSLDEMRAIAEAKCGKRSDGG